MPRPVLIAGAGIAGLVMGLTLHQIGVPFRIYEAVRDPKPLGVGINLQPPAVRELFALGLEPMLERIGVQTRDYGFYTRTGREIWTEPRGRNAGYHWPQYSVHRGGLQMELLRELQDRAGPDCVRFGARAMGYDGARLNLENETTQGAMIIAADGIHSAIRAQMYPGEGAPHWNGAILWRGTTRAQPFLSGASMILAGNDQERFVAYPITRLDTDGIATINWIAELRMDEDACTTRGDWNRRADIARFAPHFADWDFGWIDVPALIAGAEAAYEYPMVDRDPVGRWSDGPVTLIGDAAHATIPVGSSGASQAIIDARTLGAAIAAQGPGAAAAQTYEAQVRPIANAVTIANRTGGGPDAIMQMAEDRCAGDFALLDQALPMAERAAHAADFKKRAGLGIDETNSAPPLVPQT